MSLKVLHVIDQLNVGGAERVSVDLSILLKRAKVDVDFLCLLNPQQLDTELINNGVNVFYLDRKNKMNPFKVLLMHNIFQKHAIIHIHSRQVLRYAGLTMIIPNFLKNYKLIFHDHYGNIKNDRSISNYTKLCIQNCAAYIGVSQELFDWAKEKNINERIFLLENIIRKTDKKVKTKTDSQIVMIGNFRKTKNYDFLINLAKELPPFIKIDVYGNKVDEVYFNHITKRIAEEDLDMKINIIHNETNISSKLNNYEMALHCANSETGPLVSIEYMAHKLPFVCFNTGEVASNLVKADISVVMSDFEIKSWVDRINLILNDKAYRQNIVKQLSNFYIKYYSEEKYLQKCLSIYKKVD